MNNLDIKHDLEEVLSLCGKLVSQFVPTDCYNAVPEGAAETDISQYLSHQVFDLRVAAIDRFRGEKPIAVKLLQLIDEFEIFINSCEIPGVVNRWKEINPYIQYFDAAFDLMECLPEEYENIRMGNTGLKLSCFPENDSLLARRKYMDRAKLYQESLGLVYSEERAFQFELWVTIQKVFRHDFPEYL